MMITKKLYFGNVKHRMQLQEFDDNNFSLKMLVFKTFSILDIEEATACKN